MTRARLLATLVLLAALALAITGPAEAQCAMCRTALEQEGAALAGGFNRAILFLLGMPYLVFTAIAVSWYRKRRKLPAVTAPRTLSAEQPGA